MSQNRLVITGLDDLKRALRALPTTLADAATDIVEAAATDAETTIISVYNEHSVSGHLAKSVKKQTKSVGRFGAAAVVKSTDPIAWLFDNGSQARHWAGGKSTGIMWGKTPPTHVFVRSMIASRRKMYARLKDLLISHGLAVSGTP